MSLREVRGCGQRVQLALIDRYVGNREALVVAVFDDLSDQLAQGVLDQPLESQGFDPDGVIGRWTRIAAALVISGRKITGGGRFNPVLAMAKTIEEGYGLDARAARLRAAQITSAALGWRLFEGYLVEAAGLEDVSIETLRDEHVRALRRLGATPWPSPSDPVPVTRRGSRQSRRGAT